MRKAIWLYGASVLLALSFISSRSHSDAAHPKFKVGECIGYADHEAWEDESLTDEVILEVGKKSYHVRYLRGGRTATESINYNDHYYKKIECYSTKIQ